MPAKKVKKIVKRPKRMRPKFTLSGTKEPTPAPETPAPEAIETTKEPQGDLTSAVEPTRPKESFSEFQPPPSVPPPSQFVVSSSAVETSISPDSAGIPGQTLPPHQPPAEKPIIETVVTKKERSWAFPIVLLFIFIIALGAGLFYFFYLKDSVTLLTPPVATPITKIPAPTKAMTTEAPPIEFDPTEYKIRILNGSGITGQAGKAQGLLEKEGFVVSSTGNAKNYDYEETVIEVQKGIKKAFVDKLIEALSKSYPVASDTATLESATEDIIVIVGSKKVE